MEERKLTVEPTRQWIEPVAWPGVINRHLRIPIEYSEARVNYEKVIPLLGIPSSRTRVFREAEISGLKIAVFNGHEFEILEVSRTSVSPVAGLDFKFGDVTMRMRRTSQNELPEHTERSMEMFYPVDPRIIEADVNGAVRAYKNADNTGWLFSHTEEGTHHDFELNLLGALGGLFKPLFNQYQVDAIQAANEEAKNRATGLYVLLSTFYGQAFKEAKKRARAYFLGERHQEPHPGTGYLDADLTAAIETIEARWKNDSPEDLVKLTAAVAYLKTQLTMPTPETRWDRAARLKAEAEAEAGNGD